MSASDGLAQTTTSFTVTVQGTSNFGWFLRIGGPLLSIFTLLVGVYAKRALCINRYKPQRYRKPEQTALMGQEFKYTFKTPLEKIYKLQVKLPHDPRRCCSFFKHPGELFKSDRDKLPGGFELPYWLEYDMDSNQLLSKGYVPTDIRYQSLVVQVKDRAGIISEQFSLRVVSPEAAPILSQIVASDEETPVGQQESKVDGDSSRSIELNILAQRHPTSSSSNLIYAENRKNSKELLDPVSLSSSSSVRLTLGTET